MAAFRIMLIVVLAIFGTFPSSKALAFADGPKLAADTVISSIAFGSCADQYKRQPIWNAIIAAKPQAFIMVGDNVYGDVSDASMWELKTAYKNLAEHPDFSKARKAMPFLPIWDDHDYGVNDGGASFRYRQEAEQLFRNFWKIPPSENKEGLYRSHIIGPEGKRLQIILLDMRSFRSDLTKKPGAGRRAPYVPDDALDKTMLGKKQWDWLEAELKKPAEFRLIISSIQVLAEGHSWERWGNLPSEKSKLLTLIKKTGATNSLFLSGDRHLGAIYKYTDDDNATFHEFTSSSLNRPYPNAQEPGPFRVGKTYGHVNFGTISIDWLHKKIALNLRDLGGTPVRSLTFSF